MTTIPFVKINEFWIAFVIMTMSSRHNNEHLAIQLTSHITCGYCTSHMFTLKSISPINMMQLIILWRQTLNTQDQVCNHISLLIHPSSLIPLSCLPSLPLGECDPSDSVVRRVTVLSHVVVCFMFCMTPKPITVLLGHIDISLLLLPLLTKGMQYNNIPLNMSSDLYIYIYWY